MSRRSRNSKNAGACRSNRSADSVGKRMFSSCYPTGPLRHAMAKAPEKFVLHSNEEGRTAGRRLIDVPLNLDAYPTLRAKWTRPHHVRTHLQDPVRRNRHLERSSASRERPYRTRTSVDLVCRRVWAVRFETDFPPPESYRSMRESHLQ